MSIEWYIDKKSTAPIKPLHLHLKLLNFEINCIFHQITIQTAAGFHERNFNHHHFLVVIHSYLCGEKKKPSNSKRAAGKCVGLKLFIQKVANVCKYWIHTVLGSDTRIVEMIVIYYYYYADKAHIKQYYVLSRSDFKLFY